MKIARVFVKDQIRWAKVEGDTVILLKKAPFNKIELSSQKISRDKVLFLAPAAPSKVILVGLNYTDHARELGMKVPSEPLIFLKPNTAAIGPGDNIIYPKGVKRLDYEAELAIVIGRKTKDVSKGKAAGHIFGYTCLNDVTARDLQKKDVQWTRAKSFDSFAPLGPWIETHFDPTDKQVRLYLNGRLKQDSSTKNFIFSPGYLVSFISRIMTLFPGDIISTGTPPGVGSMKKGDKVEVEIEDIGRLLNRVA
ncbi:MAG: fumarylacetoacetate hydrolase family protein [Candidatus Omnitrophica bacterium]|nr:fumarylacetoacetate hydrolase family protein [Candidatus Omnitrophota bacterium]